MTALAALLALLALAACTPRPGEPRPRDASLIQDTIAPRHVSIREAPSGGPP